MEEMELEGTHFQEGTNYLALEMQRVRLAMKMNMKKGSGITPSSSSSVRPSPVIPADVDYEVQEIRDYKMEGIEDFYLIKWKNWDENANTWEPISNLHGCHYLLKMFYLDRRKLYFDARRALGGNTRGKSKKRSYAEALNPSPAMPPPIPPDPRTMDEILEEYRSFYPVTQKEFDEVLAALGTNIPKPHASKAEFSRLVGEAIFQVISPENLLHLRKLLIKLEIRKRKKHVDSENKRWGLELNYIANGKPYITIENTVDLALPPPYFKYWNYSEFLCEPTDRQASGCSCKNSCFQNRERCCGTACGSEFPYNRSGHLVVSPGTPVYECNDNCDCDNSCQNRVVQDGHRSLSGLSFCIFRTTNRGWSVKTLKSIRRGAFVALLVGEVISNEEASLRSQSYDFTIGKYLFDLEFFGDSRYVIDFSSKGNISHFFNHSCSPNLVIHPNWYNHTNYAMPRVAFYAAVDIPPETELTYSYVDVEEFRTRYGPEFKDGNIPAGFQRCECGSGNCVRFIVFPD